MRLRTLQKIAAFALLAAPLHPTEAAAGPVETSTGQARAESTDKAQRPAYTRHVLDNGLTVLIQQDDRAPMMAVSVYYHAGTPEAPKGRSGMAHLFEHLMFHGSENVRGHMSLMKKAGAVSVQGLTDVDRSHYVQVLPTANLETALWAEADRMGFLTLDQDALDHERRVVHRERRQRVDDEAYGVAREQLWEALFPEPHPYAGGLLGSHAELAAADLDDARRFHAEWYGPANATVALVGAVEPEAALALVEKYFGGLEGRRSRRKGSLVQHVASPAPRATRVRHQETATGRPALILGWSSTGRGTDDAAAAEVLVEILAGPGSPVSRALGRADGVERIAVRHALHDVASTFEIKVITRPGADLDALAAVVEEGLGVVREGGLDEATVAAARARIRNRRLAELDGVRGLGAMADLIQRDHRLGGAGGLQGELARQSQVDPTTLARFARRVLDPARRVAVHAVPTRLRSSR